MDRRLLDPNHSVEERARALMGIYASLPPKFQEVFMARMLSEKHRSVGDTQVDSSILRVPCVFSFLIYFHFFISVFISFFLRNISYWMDG